MGFSRGDSLMAEAEVTWADHALGSLFTLLGVSLVSMNTLCVKLNPNININWFIIFQGISMVLIMTALTVIRKADLNIVQTIRRNWIGISIKVFVMFFLLPVLFEVISEMPFGDIAVIMTCGPCLMVSVLAWVLFGEKLTKIQIALILGSFGGVLLIFRPGFIFGASQTDHIYPNRVTATVFCLGLCCLITAQILACRKMGFAMDPFLLNIFVGISMISSGVTYQLFISEQPLYNAEFCSQYLFNSVIVALSSVASCFISPLESLALQRTKAAFFIAIQTSKVVLDYVIQLIFFPQDGFYWTTIVGASIITVTAFDLSLKLDEKVMAYLHKCRGERIREEREKRISDAQQIDEISV